VKIGPQPPVRPIAHASNASPSTIRTGAAQVSKNRIDSVPLMMK
jgi:hypothetical protein